MADTPIPESRVRLAEFSRSIGQTLLARDDCEAAMRQFQLSLRYLGSLEHREAALTCTEIGHTYWHQGLLDQAHVWTDKSIELADRYLEPSELAHLLFVAGRRYFRHGENQQARGYWLRGLKTAEQSGDVIAQAEFYQNLGWQSTLLGDYPQALDYLEKGRKLAAEANHTPSLALIYETLGETQYALGQWDKAISSLQQSLNLAEQAGLHKAFSRALCTLGDIYRHQGQLSEADDCYRQSLESAEAGGGVQSLFPVMLSLALINMQREKLEQARDYLEQCWDIASAGAGFTARKAAVKGYLGELLILMGDLDGAATNAEAALELAQQAEARSEAAYAEMVLGTVATVRRDWATAEAKFKQALSTFEALGDVCRQAQACFQWATLYLRRAGPEDGAQAEQLLDTARQIFARLGVQ